MDEERTTKIVGAHDCALRLCMKKYAAGNPRLVFSGDLGIPSEWLLATQKWLKN